MKYIVTNLHICRGAPAGACSTALTAVDQNVLPAGHSAENPPADVAAVDRWDREMDGHLTIT